MIIGSFKRTKDRFQRLYESIKEEFENVAEHFELNGCPLNPMDILGRGNTVGLVVATFVILITLPMIIYHRGLEDIGLYIGLFSIYGLSYFLALGLVIVAHYLWFIMYVIGFNVAKFKPLLKFIEENWGSRVDQITKDALAEKGVEIESMSEFPSTKEEQETKNEDIGKPPEAEALPDQTIVVEKINPQGEKCAVPIHKIFIDEHSSNPVDKPMTDLN